MEDSVGAVNRWAGQGRAPTIQVKLVCRQDPLQGLAALLGGRSSARAVMRDLSWAGAESPGTGKELEVWYSPQWLVMLLEITLAHALRWPILIQGSGAELSIFWRALGTSATTLLILTHGVTLCFTFCLFLGKVQKRCVVHPR